MARRFLTPIDMGGQPILNVANPSAATDAATRAYVDSVARGLMWKASVRAAAIGNIDLGSLPATIDGVTLANGDRFLALGQSAPAENGIYTYSNAGGAAARTVDADDNNEVAAGMAVTVTEGDTSADKTYVLVTDGTITLGTTGLAFSLLGGATGSGPNAGDGLSMAGSTLNVGAGTGIVVTADTVAIDTNVVCRKIAASVGDGASTQITVSHPLATRDVQVQVYDNSTGETVEPEIVRPGTANSVTLRFAVAPATNAYRVVIVG